MKRNHSIIEPLARLMLIFLTSGLLLLVACGNAPTGKMEKGLQANGREVAPGERFKLEKDETVWVKETGVTIQLKGVRRSWHVDGKSESVDADIIITLDGKEQRRWMNLGDEVTTGEYIVRLRGAYPFGKTNATLTVMHR